MLRTKIFSDSRSMLGRASKRWCAAEKLEDFLNANNIKADDIVSVSFAVERDDSDRILLVWNDGK